MTTTTTKTNPLQPGAFVRHEAHPEHGVGRVLSVDSFSARVLFQNGGLRVFRAGLTAQLKNTTPDPEAVESIAAKEAAMAQGITQTPIGPKPEPVAPPKPKRAKKAK